MALCTVFLSVWAIPSVWATSAQMQKLPAFNTSGCASCHGSNDATVDWEGSAPMDLNPFGQDWVDNERQWDEVLALLNSDGDACQNGFELGDPSGTWREGQPHLSGDQPSNPGLDDCSASPIDDASWGVLKAIFGDAE